MAHTTNHGALRAFLTVNALTRMSTGLFAPLMAVFVVQLGGDLRRAGELASIYVLVATFFGMWVSLRPMRQQRIMFLASLALYVPLDLILLTVESHVELYAIQAMFGLVAGMNAPPTVYWMSRYIAPADNAPMRARDATASGFLKTAGALLGGYIAHHLGFDFVFGLMAVVSFLTLIAAVGWLDRKYLKPDLEQAMAAAD